MGGMHVHQHQPLGVLRQNVDTLELRQGIAQRWDITLTVRQRRRIGFGQGCKEFAIGGLGFGHRHTR
ncbi:hypothetical protein D3C71_1811120 [compost metagenome]